MKRITALLSGPAFLLCLLLAPLADLEGQAAAPQPPTRPGNRLYASVGLGFVNLDRSIGIGIPLGFTAALNRYRLLGTANLLDIALLEGKDWDPRYYRPYYGSSLCTDRQTDFIVPSYYCSGGTDVLITASADLSYIFFEEVWIGNQPGKLFAGIGHRFSKPRTFYGTIGIHFDARSRGAGGFKLSIGEEFVNLGIAWGIDLGRLFRGGDGIGAVPEADP